MIYSRNNPYIPKSNHPADDVSAWDFEEEFFDYLRTEGYPIELLGHRDAPDTDKYEESFLLDMASYWEDMRAESIMEDREFDRMDDDVSYWNSL